MRAEIETWTCHERLNEMRQAYRQFVDERAAQEGATFAVLNFPDRKRKITDESTDVMHVWHRPPDHWRVEWDATSDQDNRLKVHVGREWWHYSKARGVSSNADGRPVISRIDPILELMVEPWAIAGALTFEPVGEVMVAERPAIEATARRRITREDRTIRQALRGLYAGADEHHLSVDRERGILLRAAADYKGKEFWRMETREIHFDEPLGDDVFAFEPPEGSGDKTKGHE